MSEISTLSADVAKVPKRLNNAGAVVTAFASTSTTNYTAPSIGVFFVHVVSLATLTVGGVSFNSVSSSNGGGMLAIPCKAGATVKAERCTGRVTFVPEVA